MQFVLGSVISIHIREIIHSEVRAVNTVPILQVMKLRPHHLSKVHSWPVAVGARQSGPTSGLSSCAGYPQLSDCSTGQSLGVQARSLIKALNVIRA